MDWKIDLDLISDYKAGRSSQIPQICLIHHKPWYDTLSLILRKINPWFVTQGKMKLIKLHNN